MKRSFVIAVAGAVAVTGVAPVTSAMAQDRPSPTSLDQVRQNALSEMNAGNLMEVRKRGNHGWRGGNRGFRGDRGWRGNRGWRGGRGYDRRYYGGRRYHRGYRRDRGAAVAAGIAGLAIGAAIANANSAPRYRGRTKDWCASRYRTYDWRSETYIASPGVRRSCP